MTLPFEGFCIRGLFSVWLSRAMENLTAEINSRFPGTMRVSDHGTWPFSFGNVPWLIDQCVQIHGRGHPIVLIGHSFGGTSAILVNQALASKNIKVDLLCPIDPAAQYSTVITPNAQRVIGFYQKQPFQLGQGIDVEGRGWTEAEWKARTADYQLQESHLAVAADPFTHRIILKACQELVGKAA